MPISAIHYATGEPVAVDLDGGVIRAIAPLPPTDAAPSDALPTIAPALVDLQINGYAGHDFNHLPLRPELVGDVARLLWREGVTTFYPTVITNAPDVIAIALEAIARGCDGDTDADRAVAGIHLEGPFISPEDGARGAHAKAFVRPPDWDLFRRWQDAAGGRVRIVTLSPEWPDAPAFVARCVAAGVTVSIGHTAASPAQVAAAVAAGARLSTHFGNGAHLTLPRHPNYLWEQLAQDELWTCLIADGFHLPDQVLKVAMKVKGDRAVLVSDAVALAGLPPGTYATPVGGRVVLTPAGRLHLAENEALLAGSAQMLLHAVRHLTSRGLADLATAWDMASVWPARLMGLPQSGGLRLGSAADFVLLRRGVDGDLRVARTYVAGRLAFDADANIGVDDTPA
jgi:N-acetylglucosamine-6-phosphate deacetylase